MHIRTRKLIGTFALLALVPYGRCSRWRSRNSRCARPNAFVAALFYVVAGLGWVLPAMPLVSWMQRPDKARCSR